MSSPIIDVYYCDASEEYENSNDIDYHLTHDNRYRFYLIREHAEWLFTMNEVLRVWE
jgi:hypothetical protein